jgi:hypothetical protein
VRYSVKSRLVAALQRACELEARTDLECLARRGTGSQAGMNPGSQMVGEGHAPVVAVLVPAVKKSFFPANRPFRGTRRGAMIRHLRPPAEPAP